jgi:hypothetical protein
MTAAPFLRFMGWRCVRRGFARLRVHPELDILNTQGISILKPQKPHSSPHNSQNSLAIYSN